MKKGVLLIFMLGLVIFGYATTNNTITIDGTNDFAADEDIAGTSGSIWSYTWDADNFYFSVLASDVNSNDGNKWVHLYIDTDPQATPANGTGTTTGVTYNTQAPTLPFSANYHFRWKANNSYTNMLDYNTGTGSWDDDNTSGNNLSIVAFQSNTFVEFKIPRSSLGNPSQIYVAGAMINESGGSEYTYFMSPSNNNTDSYDANYSDYFGFELKTGVSPDDAANLNNSLPVEFTKFSATPGQKEIALNWQTATERNNSHFEIEKSVDGKNYHIIGEVAGAGTTLEIQNYEFMDANPAKGMNYYRLKQVDWNGDFEYSDVAAVEFSSDLNAQFFPNPVKNELTINTTAQDVSIFVYSMTGQLVKQINDVSIDGQYNLNMSELMSGIYQVQIVEGKTGNLLTKQRVVKQ